MAKKKKRSSSPPAKFSLKSLHRAFNATRTRLMEYDKTKPAVKQMKSDLNNAQAMVVCPQGMLRDMSKA